MNIQIKHDVYNIAKRIKNIEKNYFIVYNTSKKSFEVHNSRQIGTTYCLTLPYKELDERALKYVNYTKSENIEKILNKIDNENKMLESAEKSKVLSNVFEKIYQEK